MRTVATAGVAVVMLATAAGATSARETSAPYGVPGGVSGVHVGANGPLTPASYALFKVGRGEKTIALAVTDASGRAVAFDVEQDGADLGSFCGVTPTALRLRSAAPVAVTPVFGACGSGVSLPTSGTIEATFRR
jgi:hypothetical protein